MKRPCATNAHGSDWATVSSFTTGNDYPPLLGVGGGADVLHVKPTATGEASGADWHNAFTSISDAIVAMGGTRTNIWITGGTFSEGGVVTVSSGARIVGGFAGTEAAESQRSLTNTLGVVTNYTAIDGENLHKCLAVTASAGVWLDTLSISNSPSDRSLEKSSGTGNLTLNNCRIERNRGAGNYSFQITGGGVGAFFSAGSVLMTNCVVSQNECAGYQKYGYGVSAQNITLDIIDCLFEKQFGDMAVARGSRGGGLAFHSGALRIRDTEFIGNQAAANGTGGGGAIYIGNGVTMSASISNCVFRANYIGVYGTAGYGGALNVNMAAGKTTDVVNCSFVANTNMAGLGRGGAIYMTGSGTLNLKNCILWTNQVTGSGSIGHEIAVASGTLNVPYSSISGQSSPNVDGTVTFVNSREGDPLFASLTDLHLQSTAGRWDPVTEAFMTSDAAYSPCIDSGDPGDSIGDEPTDNGNSRVNMGVYGGTAHASKSPPSAGPPLVADRGYTVNYHRASISGEVTNDSLTTANIYLCYGTGNVVADTTNGWDSVVSLGEKQNGSVFSQWTPALLPTTTYYYRWYAVNGDGSRFAVATSFVTGATPPGGGADVIHVDKDAIGAADGADWANAFTTIGDGLTTIGGSRTNVWMTGGSYAEGSVLTLDTTATLIGGFAGGETAVSQRALTNGQGVVTNYTAIDGENVHKCLGITATGDVWLDTLSISNSALPRALEKSSGAGKLTLNNCRIEKNALAYGYTSGSGNGLGAYFTAGSVVMTHCVVADNQYPGTDGRYSNYGMGVYAEDVTLLDISDCVFADQYSDPFAGRTLRGAGLAFVNGTLRVTRTEFLNNQGTANGGGGGALYLGNGATMTATISNCLFRGNFVPNNSGAGYGGAVFAEINASRSASFVNCTFAANTNAHASGQGGAISLASGTMNLRNCILWTNQCTGASSTGDEISNVGGTLNANYSSLTALTSPHIAGAVNFSSCRAGDPLLASLTDLHLKSPAGRWDPASSAFVTSDSAYSGCIDTGDPTDLVGDEPVDNGNSRINMGAYGGMAEASKSPPSAGPPLIADRDCTVHFHRALIAGELTNASLVTAHIYLCYGTNNIVADTTNGWGAVQSAGEKQNDGVFSEWTPALLPTTTYYYRWYAVNGDGSNLTASASFLTGATPPGGGSNVIHVNRGATGAADGTDWVNAYTKVNDGITAITGSRTNIWITGGNYSEGLRLDLGSSAAIVGGFAGTENGVAQRALTDALGVVTNYTVINGEATHSVLNITAGNVRLDALTITNAPSGSALAKGGTGSLVVNNCRIVGNIRANNGGRGVGCTFTGGAVLMTNCVISGNEVVGNSWLNYGFGIYSSGANLQLIDCLLSDNLGDAYGSRHARGCALYFDNGTLAVLRADFVGNHGGANNGDGGGAAVYLGNNVNLSASFSNCVFRGNRALYINDTGIGRGGAVWMNLNSANAAAFVNCTFAGNSNETGSVATPGLGGAFCVSGGTLELRNSILWTNSVKDGVSGMEVYADSAGSLVDVSFSDFTGTNTPYVVAANGATVQMGNGMMTTDPLFASAADVHLQSRRGRWDPITTKWVTDRDTSPCIDSGDPADDIGDETKPHGRLINMGAYGGTEQASKMWQPAGTAFIVR